MRVTGTLRMLHKVQIGSVTLSVTALTPGEKNIVCYVMIVCIRSLRSVTDYVMIRFVIYCDPERFAVCC